MNGMEHETVINFDLQPQYNIEMITDNEMSSVRENKKSILRINKQKKNFKKKLSLRELFE